MTDFAITKAAASRFDGDFDLAAAAGVTLTPQEQDYVNAVTAALTRLAADDSRDAAASYPDDLLNGRKAARKDTADRLQADARAIVDGQAAADAARVATLLTAYAAALPKFVAVDRTPPRFGGDFRIALASGYAPSAADRDYLDNIEKSLEECAADEQTDGKGKFSPALVDSRKSLRGGLLKTLRADVAKRGGGALDAGAADQVLLWRGRYQGRRDRLESRLFNVKLYRQGQEPRSEQDCAVDVAINLLGGLPAPEDTASTEKQDLFVQIGKTNTVIQTVCRRMRARGERRWAEQGARDRASLLLDDYMNKLHGIAVIGLEMPYTALAKLALSELRNEFFAEEAGRIKNKYVRWLGGWAGLVAVAMLIAYSVISLSSGGHGWAYDHRNFLLAACGAAIGTWASFSVRQVQFTFDDLLMLEEDSLDPPVRVLFVIALTMTACLLFWTGAINIEIGNLKTQASVFRDLGSVAFLIGLFAGLSERALATAISGRAAAFVKGIGAGG